MGCDALKTHQILYTLLLPHKLVTHQHGQATHTNMVYTCKAAGKCGAHTCVRQQQGLGRGSAHLPALLRLPPHTRPGPQQVWTTTTATCRRAHTPAPATTPNSACTGLGVLLTGAWVVYICMHAEMYRRWYTLTDTNQGPGLPDSDCRVAWRPVERKNPPHAVHLTSCNNPSTEGGWRLQQAHTEELTTRHATPGATTQVDPVTGPQLYAC